MKRPYSQYTLNMTFEDNLERMFVTQRIVIHVLCLYYKIYATILFGKILEDRQQALTSEDLVVSV